MTRTTLPSQDELRRVLDYCPDTGAFTWKARGNPKFDHKYAGRPALTANSHGYRVGSVLGVRALTHQFAWKYIHGTNPAGEIDHINGDRSDNRACNLRDVSASTNRRNACRPRTNSSGVVGVYWNAEKGRWSASATIGDKHRHLGHFVAFDDAVAARMAFNKQNDFHVNHGRPLP